LLQAITADAAVQGYMLDAGQDAGTGLLSSGQYTAPGAGGGGYVVYSGFLRRPPTICPTPGAPPPSGFSPAASGPVAGGVLRKSEGLPAGPTDIVDVLPESNATVSQRPFDAFADLNGDGAASLTLALVASTIRGRSARSRSARTRAVWTRGSRSRRCPAGVTSPFGRCPERTAPRAPEPAP